MPSISSSVADSRTAAAPAAFGQIYFAFAAAYLLSYVFRTGNAVISPDLTRELSLKPSSLGLLTAAYFLAFGAMQLPVGMLLDRFGPRRVEPALLMFAGLGAFIFASAESLGGLILGRALIGIGVCACLMAPLKAIAAWYPAQRQASLSGWIMSAGAAGALAATAPLELALHVLHWRTIFVLLGIAAIASGVVIWWRVPDIAKPAESAGFAAQWAGVRRVFAHPRFWWIAPVAGVGIGSFMAIQGLWAVPWLMEVEGHSRAEAARHLFAMTTLVVVGSLALGLSGTWLAQRGVDARHLFAIGFGLSFVALACILMRLPGSYLWWSLYGTAAAVNVLAFTVVNEGFGRDLAGRTNTSLNLVMFAGSFASQWGIGLVVDTARLAAGLDTAAGLRVAFCVVLALDVVVYLWFIRGWRRHARLARPEMA